MQCMSLARVVKCVPPQAIFLAEAPTSSLQEDVPFLAAEQHGLIKHHEKGHVSHYLHTLTQYSQNNACYCDTYLRLVHNYHHDGR